MEVCEFMIVMMMVYAIRHRHWLALQDSFTLCWVYQPLAVLVSLLFAVPLYAYGPTSAALAAMCMYGVFGLIITWQAAGMLMVGGITPRGFGFVPKLSSTEE